MAGFGDENDSGDAPVDLREVVLVVRAHVVGFGLERDQRS